MDELTQILIDATRQIEPGYFKLAIDGDAPIYRERVYCYELYHQMRLCWPKSCKHVLNGEVDKSGHHLLRELKLDGFKPDFLIHRPGWMMDNFAIMEVKRHRARGEDISKDLAALTLFVRKAKYRRAIYLVFGENAEKTLRHVRRIAGGMGCLAEIELWAHAQAGESARHVDTLLAKNVQAGKKAVSKKPGATK